MATPPTLASTTQSAWNSNATPKTFSETLGANTYLLVAGTGDDVTVWSTPTGGGLTYSTVQSVVPGAGFGSSAEVWSAPNASSQTYTQSLAKTSGASGNWGFMDTAWSGTPGFGTSVKAGPTNGGAPSVSITTSGNNSAVYCFIGDYSGSGISTRAWLTVNGTTPTAGNGFELVATASITYTTYAAYWPNCGNAGSITVGMSAPTQIWSIIAVEVLGTASSITANSRFVKQAINRASTY